MLNLKKTALYDEHLRHGGKMVDFGGWALPIQYTGVMDEHLACRNSAALFDVSHMGEFSVEGNGAERFLNLLLTNDVSKVAIGQAQYSALCLETGGIVDDLVIYRRSQNLFLVVVNASNTDKDFAHFEKIYQTLSPAEKKNVGIKNDSEKYSQIAIQGRNSEKILKKISHVDLSKIGNYRFIEDEVLGKIPAILARTGYTGEDGFEVYVAWEKGPEIWRALLEAGKEFQLRPCGLGARDTLRLEMKYSLYGHELSESVNPLEAGLGWVVKLNKDTSFIGKKAIEMIKQRGLSRNLVGLKMIERGIPRQGYPLFSVDGETQLGEITSGTHSPSLNHAIGIGYVRNTHSTIGTQIRVGVRESKVLAEIVQTPFYKRPY